MMSNSFYSATTILLASAFILGATIGEESGITFTEKGLSSLGYHLCNYTVAQHVNKMVAYQKSYEKKTLCGGWIPSITCTKTYYKEAYHPVTISETVNLTDCCAGYEQVGLYCSLPLNRSREFASRPGACPSTEVEALNTSCTLDTDCPDQKKCCKTSNGAGCLIPVPDEQSVTKHWYNVSVLVKMDFIDLKRVDPRLLTHSRLLHSLITGALWPLNVSVYHIQTIQAEHYPETLISQVLVGLLKSVPLVNVSSMLKDIVMRIYEVIDIVVQDLDAGYQKVLFKNRNDSALVTNSTTASQTPDKSLDLECDAPAIRDHKIYSVTTNSFEMSWSVNSVQNHSFWVEVYKSKELVQRIETMDRKLDVFSLEAGVMYKVNISYEICGKNITSSRNVKADALTFGLVIRILNYNFTDKFLNRSSTEYQTFSSILMKEVNNSFPSNIIALYETRKLKVEIDSLKPGSIIVRLKIIIGDLQFPNTLSVFDSVLSALFNSSMFLIDEKNSFVEDWDECASVTENDCCRYAECINMVGSYICRCKTTTDANPSRPGRNCEGEIVDPVTEMAPTLDANVTEALSVTTVITVERESISTVTSSPDRVTVLSTGIQEASMAPTDKTSLTSPEISTSGYVISNSSLSTLETSTVVSKSWENVTVSDGILVERVTQGQHNSSSSTSAGLSKTTVYSFVKNESMGNTSTSDHLTDRDAQKYSTSFPNVTQHHEHHAPENNKTEESSAVPVTSSKEHTVALPASDCGEPFPVERIVFSNVTNTSFHVVWTTNKTRNSTFHLRLLERRFTKQEFKVHGSSLTISKLDPGILYTVEIRTEVCGKRSKPVQLKVKTVAQIFSGTVRITNLNYSSCFSNSSSEQYHNFTQLFLNEVRKSLPIAVLQKMDADIIKMLILSVTNGSVVVNFNIVVPVDIDANNISRTFLDAFRNSSRFVIDPSSLSIHDYDECKQEETDCSPHASCNNTYGSYECKCTEGFISVNTERPGRNCEVPFINYTERVKTKDRSSTVLPLTHPYTSNSVPPSTGNDFSVSTVRGLENTTSTLDGKITSKPILNIQSSLQASSLPVTKPPRGISIKNAVQVLCEFEKIVISIQKAFLKQESILESSLYLGKPHCNVSRSNSSHVILQTAWSQCGTEVQTNNTHTIVKTILRNDGFSPGVIRHLHVASPIHCVFQNDLLTSSGYSQQGVYTIFEDLHGSGRFLTEMQLFFGNAPIPQNFSISASDEIKIEVGIRTEDNTLKVVISECWATPSNNSVDHLSFPFIRGSCPVPDTHATMISNGMSNKAQFKLKIFSFVNDSEVFLHCKIHVCMEVPRSTCKITCGGFRSQRMGETIAIPRTSWGPLRKARATGVTKEEKKPGLGAGYIVLIIIGTFVLILGIAGLLIWHHQRKAGAYNFQIKSDNFNYQVFYD